MGTSINNVLAVRAVDATASGTNTTFTMLRAATVTDLLVITDDGAAQTVTLRNGANAISAAIAPGTVVGEANRPAQLGDWIAARKDLASGAVLTFVPSGAIAYTAYAYLYPTPGATR